jgi:dienelactone hydrolase
MKKIVRRLGLALIIIIALGAIAAGAMIGPYYFRVQHFPANTGAGYHADFYLYVSPRARSAAQSGGRQTILVQPNNSGTNSDDADVHRRDAWWTGWERQSVTDELGVILLVPAFIRPGEDWKIYTHALDRDSLTTKRADIARLDLQLLAMIDHATRRLALEGIMLDKRVVMVGYSASGMFVNRFVFLHPERVKAAAIGSPGGWPIAPVGKWNGKALPYPIGIADLGTVAGAPFKKRLVEKVPLFVFMGADDTNDSVIFGDSYETVEKELVFELFGKTPAERWPAAEGIYRNAIPTSQFKLYPAVGHKLTKEMMADVIKFLEKHLND